MIVGSWHGKRDLLPWIITAAVSIAAHRWLPGQWYTLLGALAGSIVALVQRAR
jgi:predicted branched-subunit amino acid permease